MCRDELEEWWSQFGTMDLEGEQTTPDEVRAIREYLEGDTTPSVAASRFMSLREDKVPADGDWDKGSRVSWFLAAVQEFYANKHDAILDLVDAIKEMPELDMTEEQRKRFGETWKNWRDLDDYEQISWLQYDRAHDYRYPNQNVGGPASPSWVAASVLAAKNCVRYHDCEAILRFRAFPTIISTLEQDPWNHVPADPAKRTKTAFSHTFHEYHITMLNTAVLGLAPWFLIAGRLIYNYEDNRAKSIVPDDQLVKSMKLKYRGANLWHGEPRFTMERWAFWKDRLRWIAMQDALLPETRSKAEMLVGCMDDVEKDPQPEVWKNWAQSRLRSESYRWLNHS